MKPHASQVFFYLATLLGCLQMTAQAQGLIKEVVIPAAFIRALLPADGEVISSTITKNKWPDNKPQGPFFQNETAEFALGLLLRAQQGDRGNERALLPGVTFKNGYLGVQGGWRVHKQMPIHNDFFDGKMEGQMVVGYAGGKSHVESAVKFKWNASWGATLVSAFIGDILPSLNQRAGTAIAQKINTELPAKMDEAIYRFLADNGIPSNLQSHVVAEVVAQGLWIRVYEEPIVARSVTIPALELKPGKVGRGDRDFSGNGPNVKIKGQMLVTADKVELIIQMHAKETKEDWTEASGEKRAPLYTAQQDETIIDILGPTNLDLVDEIVEGHSPAVFSTLLGKVTVYGDRRGDDVADYTRMKISDGATLLILTRKK